MADQNPETDATRRPPRLDGIRPWSDDGMPAEVAKDLEAATLALPMDLPELESDVDLDEALEDARWQTTVCRSIVCSIEEEIAHVRSAPEIDERELDRLTEDLHEYSRIYLLAALDAALLLERWRRLQAGAAETAEVGDVEEEQAPQLVSLPVVPSSAASLVPSGQARYLAR